MAKTSRSACLGGQSNVEARNRCWSDKQSSKMTRYGQKSKVCKLLATLE